MAFRFPVAFRLSGVRFLGILFPLGRGLSLRSAFRQRCVVGTQRGLHVSHM